MILVEKSDHLGGKMANLSGTYLNFAAAPDLLTRRIDRVLNHPNIQVITAEVSRWMAMSAISRRRSRSQGHKGDKETRDGERQDVR